ncbi:hypothetical protein SAMN06265182_0410 [Persephonella hydrogeniphila]|uniref:Phosphate-selective porin O and P n=1 Tax=Persephonella hydrogeniphila TaxID=198703 RepID=A0A285N407_9AQUI|nr:hypothetical protein [Persephonella hydrogeniphila]SNZ03557.1 hypothetical protein SAMN06265182_0410 [Persephonella hydrogeniphila]
MRKIFLTAAILGVVGISNAGEIQNPIIKKLYEKGVLTKEEAVQLEKDLSKKETPVSSKSKKLKFGGKAYIGYTYTDKKDGKDEGNFEVRRGYFVTKFYFNKKDHARFTLDVTKHYHKDDPDEGKEINVKIKHLYLYKDISSIIPATGFELGIAHTPWLDYEEHSGWWFRSISKTFYEAKDGAHLLPSADAGIDFKTKTEYFSAEYGIFDGEGYDHIGRKDKGSKGNKPMIEGRLTWHILGGGKKKPKPLSQRYANISLHALNSFNHRGSDDDLTVYQIHGVYNQPLFLIAGQYIKSNWYTGSENSGDGYSLNFEIRPLLDHKISFFGRYDSWDSDKYDRQMYIYGIAWHMNKYVTWIANGITADYDKYDNKDYIKYMITAELHY